MRWHRSLLLGVVWYRRWPPCHIWYTRPAFWKRLETSRSKHRAPALVRAPQDHAQVAAGELQVLDRKVVRRAVEVPLPLLQLLLLLRAQSDASVRWPTLPMPRNTGAQPMRCDAMQCNAMRCNTMQYNTMRSDAMGTLVVLCKQSNAMKDGWIDGHLLEAAGGMLSSRLCRPIALV